MTRSLFLTLYVSGIVVIWFTGEPWSRINFILLNPSKPWAALTIGFFVSLLVPFALIAVAAARGRAVNQPRLHRLPVTALLLSAVAFVSGWLSRALAGGSASAWGSVSMSIAMGIGLVAALGPLLLHVVCCVRGASERKAPVIRGELAS